MDTDGTFWTDEEESQYVCGPIDPVKLEQRQIATNYNIRVVVVSESPYYPKKEGGAARFPIVNNEGSRYYNLLKAKEDYGRDGDICIYVDDLDIWKKDADKAGFLFFNALHFAAAYGVLHV